MADPIDLRILQFLQTRLRSMTVAGGYTWNVKTDRVTLDPVSIITGVGDCTSNPFFVVELQPGGQRRFEPAEQLKDAIEGTILARVDTTGSHPDRRNSVGLKLVADIEEVLVRLPSRGGTADITCGGLATDIRLRRASTFQDGGATNQIVIVVVPFLVTLHRVYGQPRG
jgi:hypothetical protein